MSKICDDLRTAILQTAIQGRLTEQLPEDGNATELLAQIRAKSQKPLTPITADEIPFTIPDNWQWVKLSDLCTIVTGKKDANFGSEDGKYRFFTCARKPIYSHSFSFSGEALLLAGNGDISNISYYDGPFEAYQRTYVLQPFIPHSYLQYLEKHLLFNWVAYNKDKMFGTAIPYIRLSNVKNYPVALPPLAEQKRIVAKVNELMACIDDLEQSTDALTSLDQNFSHDIKASLLQAAVQGQLTEQSPTNWPQVKLEQIATLINGYAFKSHELSKEPKPNYVRVIRISDFNSDGLTQKSPVYVADNPRYTNFTIHKNDILMCMTGGTVGKCCLLNECPAKMFLNQRVADIRVSSSVNPQYIYICHRLRDT